MLCITMHPTAQDLAEARISIEDLTSQVQELQVEKLGTEQELEASNLQLTQAGQELGLTTEVGPGLARAKVWSSNTREGGTCVRGGLV